jgi:hypothetical protein
VRYLRGDLFKIKSGVEGKKGSCVVLLKALREENINWMSGINTEVAGFVRPYPCRDLVLFCFFYLGQGVIEVADSVNLKGVARLGVGCGVGFVQLSAPAPIIHRGRCFVYCTLARKSRFGRKVWLVSEGLIREHVAIWKKSAVMYIRNKAPSVFDWLQRSGLEIAKQFRVLPHAPRWI